MFGSFFFSWFFKNAKTHCGGGTTTEHWGNEEQTVQVRKHKKPVGFLKTSQPERDDKQRCKWQEMQERKRAEVTRRGSQRDKINEACVCVLSPQVTSANGVIICSCTMRLKKHFCRPLLKRAVNSVTLSCFHLSQSSCWTDLSVHTEKKLSSTWKHQRWWQITSWRW